MDCRGVRGVEITFEDIVALILVKDRNGGFGLSGVNICGDGEKEMDSGFNKDLRSPMDKT